MNRELEWFAAFVHIVLATLHALSAVFNWKRSHRVFDGDALVHVAACAYDVQSAVTHVRRVRSSVP